MCGPTNSTIGDDGPARFLHTTTTTTTIIRPYNECIKPTKLIFLWSKTGYPILWGKLARTLRFLVKRVPRSLLITYPDWSASPGTKFRRSVWVKEIKMLVRQTVYWPLFFFFLLFFSSCFTSICNPLGYDRPYWPHWVRVIQKWLIDDDGIIE